MEGTHLFLVMFLHFLVEEGHLLQQLRFASHVGHTHSHHLQPTKRSRHSAAVKFENQQNLFFFFFKINEFATPAEKPTANGVTSCVWKQIQISAPKKK